MTNASLSSSSFLLLYLQQVFICEIYVLPQLRQFKNSPQEELAQEGPYIFDGIRLRLHKLQAKDKQAQKLKTDQQFG